MFSKTFTQPFFLNLTIKIPKGICETFATRNFAYNQDIQLHFDEIFAKIILDNFN